MDAGLEAGSISPGAYARSAARYAALRAVGLAVTGGRTFTPAIERAGSDSAARASYECLTELQELNASCLSFAKRHSVD
jgi:hypothetical protein